MEAAIVHKTESKNDKLVQTVENEREKPEEEIFISVVNQFQALYRQKRVRTWWNPNKNHVIVIRFTDAASAEDTHRPLHAELRDSILLWSRH